MSLPTFMAPPGEDLPPPLHLLELVVQFVVARAAMVAAGLGLPDHMGDKACTPEELASACGAHAPSLRRLLRLLAGAGLVASDPSGRYRLTPVGACLRSDHPASMAPLYRMLDGPILRVALEVGHTVRTGEPADQVVLGDEVFEYLAKHPADGEIFNEAMTGFRRQFTGPILMAYDFSGFSTLVDVGGGHGFFLASVLLANPGTSCVIFDQPHVVVGARAAMADFGVADRATVVGGDFFEAVPEGDGYVLSWIIHDWDDERALTILRNCRQSIAPGGRLLLIEAVVPAGDEPHFAKVLDAVLMTMGGVERTEAEYADLLARAGFRLERVVPTMAPLSVLEATPV
jgi:hypothetical protein